MTGHSYQSNSYAAACQFNGTEVGITPDFVETLLDPIKVQTVIIKLLKSARDEILVIFSTANAVRRQECSIPR
jgi:hypothetical protein